MHLYRSHTCGELSSKNVGEEVKLSGWIDRKRDHGGLLFIDLRDQYGIIQIVIDSDSDFFHSCEAARLESVVTIIGKVFLRDKELINSKISSGDIEVKIDKFILSLQCKLSFCGE